MTLGCGMVKVDELHRVFCAVREVCTAIVTPAEPVRNCLLVLENGLNVLFRNCMSLSFSAAADSLKPVLSVLTVLPGLCGELIKEICSDVGMRRDDLSLATSSAEVPFAVFLHPSLITL